MKLPFDKSLRGSSSFRRLEEEVKRWRQSAGWSDDDNYLNRNSSNKGNYRYYKTDSSSSVNNGGYSKYSPTTQNNSADHWFQSISKPLGFALVFIATAACFSIFCAILRKTRRRRNAIVAEKDVGDGGVGLGGEKASNLLRGRSRSRTPARTLQSSSQSPPQPRKYHGQSLPEYADEGERYPSRSSLPPSHGREITADYVPMVDMHAPTAAPRTVNNNKTPNRGRSRSRNIIQEDQRTRSKSRRRSVPPPPIVRLTRRT
jgi:hypothetical protein